MKRSGSLKSTEQPAQLYTGARALFAAGGPAELLGTADADAAATPSGVNDT